MKKVIVIGGGISGMITAIQLAHDNMPVTLLEKKSYPLHKVCGEYISNEAIPFLKSLNLFPSHYSPPAISRLQLTSVTGRPATLTLKSGGFGISRFAFDHFLYQHAMSHGVEVLSNFAAENVTFVDDRFVVLAGNRTLEADLVVGAFGKRSNLDKNLGRDFFTKRSPFIGVKYHIRNDHPPDLISLHNFKGGYCGSSRIEDGKVNLCYLSHRENLRSAGSIQKLEESVLFRNPFLRSIFNDSEFLFDKPEVINEISFETKQPVDQHILMTGDAAGMITPLCGNGMAMAIHSAKLLYPLLLKFCGTRNYSRSQLEQDYTRVWNEHFKKRLWAGRQIQGLFGSEFSSNIAVAIARHVNPLARWLVNQTHGSPF